MKKISAVVLGYGSRGAIYSKYAVQEPEKLEIVAVAEPNENRRAYAAGQHELTDDYVFADWRQLAAKPKMADFAIIATQDAMHLEPALEMIEKGYDLLLEKPMAVTEQECRQITEAAEKKGVRVVVCHVLRFTSFWKTLKELIDTDRIGQVMSIVHMENVGHLHQSHSFVRGNWSNTQRATPMILQKCCHDTDILQWLIGKPCNRVQSFGSLTHFTKENQPAGAPDRCVDGCPHSESCFYNAVKLYYEDKENVWFRSAAANTSVNPTDEQVLQALRTGPYGRCVYACDNDVVDHQLVNMEFEGGITASLSMNAFNKGGRFIRVFGTKGEISVGDKGFFNLFTFETGQTLQIPIAQTGNDITSGHGGGDRGIMEDVVRYFGEGIASKSICDIRTSYLSHKIAFAAEKSRQTGEIVAL